MPWSRRERRAMLANSWRNRNAMLSTTTSRTCSSEHKQEFNVTSPFPPRHQLLIPSHGESIHLGVLGAKILKEIGESDELLVRVHSEQMDAREHALLGQRAARSLMLWAVSRVGGVNGDDI